MLLHMDGSARTQVSIVAKLHRYTPRCTHMEVAKKWSGIYKQHGHEEQVLQKRMCSTPLLDKHTSVTVEGFG